MSENTLKNLQTIKDAQTLMRSKLNEKYIERIKPFVDIIMKVSEAQNVNEFEAIPIIQKHLSIYKKPGASIMFSAALMEIVDGKYLGKLPN